MTQGLQQLIQTYVDIAASRGKFTVSIDNATFFGRKAVRKLLDTECEEEIKKIKPILQQNNGEFCLSVTVDLFTDRFLKRSYMDVHAFWIDEAIH